MQATIALVEAARSGDRAQLNTLVEQVWPDAFRIAWSVLHDRALAEDAAQEACAKLLVSLRDLRDPRAFKTWFYRLVVNAAVQETRRRRDAPSADADAQGDDDRPEPALAETLDAADRADLKRAVAALDPLYRLPLVLRYYDDLSSQEIGRVLGLPAGTVRYRLAVARDRLRAALTPDPGPPSTPASSPS